ncbi:TPA: hypothetical protein DCZ90_05495 [Candidatus Amesbacteria bacterium]|nr:hypothetical protein [Candidatus Amesbacteria bacterium]
MISYQLDTNTLFRFLTNDIPRQRSQVEDLIRKAKRHQVTLHVCEPIFIETAVTLKNYFKYPKNKIVDLLGLLINSSELTIENRQLLIKSLDTYADHALDFVDCVLLIRTQTLNHRLFSFDRHLLSLT